MVTEVTITNNKNSKQFLFRAVAPIRNKKEQPVISIPLINTTPDDTILFRFFGQSEEITFSFAIYNDGTDASNGTETTPIPITIDQQIDYLRDDIFSHEFDTTWTVQQERYYPSGSTMTGVITNLEFDNPAGGVSLVTGTITIRRGNIGAL